MPHRGGNLPATFFHSLGTLTSALYHQKQPPQIQCFLPINIKALPLFFFHKGGLIKISMTITGENFVEGKFVKNSFKTKKLSKLFLVESSLYRSRFVEYLGNKLGESVRVLELRELCSCGINVQKIKNNEDKRRPTQVPGWKINRRKIDYQKKKHSVCLQSPKKPPSPQIFRGLN